jgi:uroporphyrinogen decarboxylase
MTRRDVVRLAIQWKKPPYVPWSLGFTLEAREKLVRHFGTKDLGPELENHMGGAGTWVSEDIGGGCFRDDIGVVWDRSVDKDIGVVKGCVLPEPTLRGFSLPDPKKHRVFQDLAARLDGQKDLYLQFNVGFSLFERAWTLRGMENLYLDFVENPRFAHELLGTIADYNIALVREAAKYDFDAVHFGDDWGSQHGLLMGPKHWHTFLYPPLKRMYKAVHDTGRLVTIHSCGDVDELFDDLVGIGLNCFNPFQPEVMDVYSLLPRYRGRLAFHGGLSTQRTLPYGTPEDVRRETRRLLDLGRDGGYILAPAHAVEGDVPLENMLAMIDTCRGQARG